MGFSSYEEFSDTAKRLIAVAYDVKVQRVVGIEENQHPTHGFTTATVGDVSGRLFSVSIFPNCEILLSRLTEG